MDLNYFLVAPWAAVDFNAIFPGDRCALMARVSVAMVAKDLIERQLARSISAW